MATRNEWDELQYYNKENQGIRTTTWKTGTDSSMTQMLLTTERTMPQRTSPLAQHSTTERAHVVLFLTHFITLTLAQEWVLPALHIHLHAMHGCLSLTRPTPLSTSQPSSSLSSSSPSSTSATSSSPELNKKIMENLCDSANNGVTAPTTSSTSPQVFWAQRPWLQRAPEPTSPPLLQDPCRGLGRGWPDTRQDAHWSVPRTSRLLRTRRRVSQSVSRRRL